MGNSIKIQNKLPSYQQVILEELEKLTVEQLKEIAKGNNINYYYKMSKNELINKLIKLPQFQQAPNIQPEVQPPSYSPLQLQPEVQPPSYSPLQLQPEVQPPSYSPLQLQPEVQHPSYQRVQLEKLSVRQLREMAKQYTIYQYYKMNKKQLVDSLIF
jgi:hypothetical protein